MAAIWTALTVAEVNACAVHMPVTPQRKECLPKFLQVGDCNHIVRIAVVPVFHSILHAALRSIAWGKIGRQLSLQSDMWPLHKLRKAMNAALP